MASPQKTQGKENQILTCIEDLHEDYIGIMTDVDLHPLPITPNDPLSIVSK